MPGRILSRTGRESRKNAYVITAVFVVLSVYLYPRLPTGAISQLKNNVLTGYKDFIPAIINLIEKVKEPTSFLDIQMRMLFAAVVFVLIGSFALLALARR